MYKFVKILSIAALVAGLSAVTVDAADAARPTSGNSSGTAGKKNTRSNTGNKGSGTRGKGNKGSGTRGKGGSTTHGNTGSAPVSSEHAKEVKALDDRLSNLAGQKENLAALVGGIEQVGCKDDHEAVLAAEYMFAHGDSASEIYFGGIACTDLPKAMQIAAPTHTAGSSTATSGRTTHSGNKGTQNHRGSRNSSKGTSTRRRGSQK